MLKSPFSRSNALRKHPLVSSLHRGIDGALVGVFISGAFMTSLALHSQYLWTLNFSRLQLTRDLIHRLEESTSILETYFIKSASSPNSMFATKTANLLYIDTTLIKKTPIKHFLESIKEHLAPASYPVTNGY